MRLSLHATLFLTQRHAASAKLLFSEHCISHLLRRVDLALILHLCLQSCGTCKEVLQHCSKLCHETSQQKAGVLFLKHNIWNDFDDLTDIARMYKTKAVPSFIFLTGGAMVSLVFSVLQPSNLLSPQC